MTKPPGRENRQCDLSDKPIQNDCHLKLEFGWGSDIDGSIYHFDLCNELGHKVLDYITTLYSNGKSINNHCIHRPTLD